MALIARDSVIATYQLEVDSYKGATLMCAEILQICAEDRDKWQQSALDQDARMKQRDELLATDKINLRKKERIIKLQRWGLIILSGAVVVVKILS